MIKEHAQRYLKDFVQQGPPDEALTFVVLQLKAQLASINGTLEMLRDYPNLAPTTADPLLEHALHNSAHMMQTMNALLMEELVPRLREAYLT